ncbi:EamA family transporter [Diaphorobacter caeni]|uniref:EamA family transporter n=1 Tax=Diaphorobacter caeni TaxID=2784387 RepID=UPI00188F734F|nr:EamA family transporter [Diaphorobacter caeni]MBF5003977.1 EamA family transporter [Diaphorobacter caeni]
MTTFLTSITVLCVLGISFGQLLFKRAAQSIANASNWQDWIFNGWLIGALALYGLTTLVWVWVLRNAPLHLAYPFMGLAFLFVPILGWLILGERVQTPTIIGGVLILAGITIASRAS